MCDVCIYMYVWCVYMRMCDVRIHVCVCVMCVYMYVFCVYMYVWWVCTCDVSLYGVTNEVATHPHILTHTRIKRTELIKNKWYPGVEREGGPTWQSCYSSSQSWGSWRTTFRKKKEKIGIKLHKGGTMAHRGFRNVQQEKGASTSTHYKIIFCQYHDPPLPFQVCYVLSDQRLGRGGLNGPLDIWLL